MLKVKKASLAWFWFSHCNEKYYNVVHQTKFNTFRFSEEVKCFTKVRPSISTKMIIIRTVYIILSLLVFFCKEWVCEKIDVQWEDDWGWGLDAAAVARCRQSSTLGVTSSQNISPTIIDCNFWDCQYQLHCLPCQHCQGFVLTAWDR